MIDLHIHSTFSDGSFTPSQLVKMALDSGLRGISLTDHDTTAGLKEFMKSAKEFLLPAIPGVEMSAEVNKGTMHILGYYIDCDNKILANVLSEIRDGRHIRNKKILEKLQANGFDINWDEVLAFAGTEVVGRPHFAMALVKKGYVPSKEEAFNNYLAKGKIAYVDRFRLTPQKSIETILASGGLAVLAHPYTLELPLNILREAIRELKNYGLSGMEVYYSEHTQQMTNDYMQICLEQNLIPTGGSDFHGEINPSIKMGTGFGNLCVPDEIMKKLEFAVKDKRKVGMNVK